MWPSASRVTPGISLLPRTRGPIPERKIRLPTRLACGNAPTASGARELSNVSAMSCTIVGQPLRLPIRNHGKRCARPTILVEDEMRNLRLQAVIDHPKCGQIECCVSDH